jgi:spore coat protein U-like protein
MHYYEKDGVTMMRFLSRAVPALALLALAAPAFAQSANLAINANVQATCRVTTAAPAIAVNWDLFDNATATNSGAINVRCTKGLTVQVAADGGTHSAAGGFLRSVQNAASDAIGYKLALSAAGAELAVNSATATTVATAGRGTDVPVNFFVTLDTAADPAGDGSGPAPGAYTDTVVVTFTAL